MMLPEHFDLAGGTIIGTDHLHLNIPNQDAYCIQAYPGLLVGIVCDGCGDPTSPHSQVGAHLIARLVASKVALLTYGASVVLVPAITNKITGFIHQTACSLAGIPIYENSDSLPEDLDRVKVSIIRDYFLCTVVGFAITNDNAYFFSCGDGVVIVNGENIPLGPFPNNAPPYLGYNLLGSSLLSTDPGKLALNTVYECATPSLDSFLIGSDGVSDLAKSSGELHPDGKTYVGPINQFWLNDKYFSNKDMVRRKLSMINKEKVCIDWEARSSTRKSGLLHDDTTLVVGRSVRLRGLEAE